MKRMTVTDWSSARSYIMEAVDDDERMERGSIRPYARACRGVAGVSRRSRLSSFLYLFFAQCFFNLCPALSVVSVVRNRRCPLGEMVVRVVEVNRA